MRDRIYADPCSTPFGINERGTGALQLHRRGSKVLNAFRHQRTRNPPRFPPVRHSGSAQRLSASTNEEPRPSQSLAAAEFREAVFMDVLCRAKQTTRQRESWPDTKVAISPHPTVLVGVSTTTPRHSRISAAREVARSPAQLGELAHFAGHEHSPRRYP